MSVGDVPQLPAGLVEELARQAERCRPTSPLYGELLTEVAADAERGGVAARLLAPYAHEPVATVPGLRLMAAVHALVLAGRAPQLAAFYPSAGGDGAPEEAWPAFHAVLERHEEELRPAVATPVQTNEPGRSVVLFGGLVALTALTGLPVRLLEVGASAGLNLRADRFAYQVGDWVLGDPGSPVVFEDPWEGEPPGTPSAPQVVERRGCDLRPIDPTTEDGRSRLLSLVWADRARAERLRAAIEVAARVPATVDAAPADEWLPEQLADPRPGVLTVVWHSVVRQYVDPIAWRRVGEALERAGEAATTDAPLAHLAFEPDIGADGLYVFSVRLTLWPGGRTLLLGAAAPHGVPARWA
jgi:hypothetical protein